MKPVHIKPALYTMFYEHMKNIAQEYGYNLVVHGSMNRDLDLIAIPWIDNPRSEQEMIHEFQIYLSGKKVVDTEGETPFNILPGGRHSYTISLNRGDRHGEWFRFEDREYYLDISVTPLKTKKPSDNTKP